MIRILYCDILILGRIEACSPRFLAQNTSSSVKLKKKWAQKKLFLVRRACIDIARRHVTHSIIRHRHLAQFRYRKIPSRCNKIKIRPEKVRTFCPLHVGQFEHFLKIKCQCSRCQNLRIRARKKARLERKYQKSARIVRNCASCRKFVKCAAAQVGHSNASAHRLSPQAQHAFVCAGCWLLDLGQLVETPPRDLCFCSDVGAEETDC